MNNTLHYPLSHCGYNAYLTKLHRSCDIKSQHFPYVLSLSIYSVVLVLIHPAVMRCIVPVTFTDNNDLKRGVHFASRKCKFKVCKSVHHRTIQINHQPDATIFQFIILTFIYSSTCFRRFPAHHQELNDCSGSL